MSLARNETESHKDKERHLSISLPPILPLFLILLGVLAPLLPLVIWSFAHRWFFPDVLPAEWSWRAWTYVFSGSSQAVSYTHLRAHETVLDLVCRLLLEKKKINNNHEC